MTPRRSFTRIGVVLAVVALASGMVVGFGESLGSDKSAPAANMPPPSGVSVAQVVSRDVRQWDEFTGRVTAVETVELRPRVSGYVERVAYEEGQEVRKGDLLFLIDQRSYRAAFDRARAEPGTCPQRVEAGGQRTGARADARRRTGDFGRGVRRPEGGGHPG